MKLIRAVPDIGTKMNSWAMQLVVAISEDLEGVPMAFAQTHCNLSQRVCSMIVRERVRGPKGGRGAFTYNSGLEWPEAWRPNKNYHYYLVQAVMPKNTSTKQRMGSPTGSGTATRDPLILSPVLVDEVAPFNTEAWRKLPYHAR